MEPTQSSETPGKYPEDYFSLLQHGESLKTRIISLLLVALLTLFILDD
jgi:hypothetical protein